MVRAGLDSELVSFGPGVPYEALGFEAALMRRGIVLRGGFRRALIFSRSAHSLIDFHQRLQLRIVIAPVRTHVRMRRVAEGDPPVTTQVRIQDAAAVHFHLSLLRLLPIGERECAYAALREGDIAMPVGIIQAALVTEESREPAGDVEEVHCLLYAPP